MNCGVLFKGMFPGIDFEGHLQFGNIQFAALHNVQLLQFPEQSCPLQNMSYERVSLIIFNKIKNRRTKLVFKFI